MKSFSILGGNGHVVELPVGSDKTVAYGLTSLTPYINWMGDDGNLVEVTLPPGIWRIVGMLPEVRELHAAGIVDDASFKYPNLFRRKFEDYKCEAENDYDTALESLESSILAEGWYFENTCGDRPDYANYNYGYAYPHPSERKRFERDLSEWYEAQSRVLSRERCLLLRRVDL